MFAEFINTYGMQLMYAVITAIAGYLGIVFKNLAKKFFNDKTKKEVAKNAVQFVEQVFKNLHGEEILGTLGIAEVFLGTILQISSAQYKKKASE